MSSQYLEDDGLSRQFEIIFDEFAMRELREGRCLPDEASDFVLRGLTHHFETEESKDMSSHELDDVLERFETFLHQQPVKGAPTKPLTINESLIDRCKSLANVKNNEFQKILDGTRRLLEQQNNFQGAFESSASLMELNVDCLDARIELLRKSILKYLLHKTPETRKAFEQLNNIVTNDKEALMKRVVKLEKQFANYKEIENDQKYGVLLKKWKKLKHEKQLLSVEDTDLMHSFSNLTAN